MSVYLEISTHLPCVLDCRYCPQSVLKSEYKSDIKRLSLENFKKAVDKLPPDSSVTFAGFNEPFINPECTDMVLYAYRHGLRIGMFTTLLGLSIENYKKIKDINWNHFSCHLPDSDGYTKISMTEKYLELLTYFRDNPPAGKFVGFHHHHGELHEKIRDIIPKSHIRVIHDRAGKIHEKNIISSHYNAGILKCGHAFLFSNSNNTEGSGVMVPDGSVYLCCNDFGLQHKLGNLFEQSWQEIMQGDEMKKICNGLTDETVDILCRNCCMATNPRDIEYLGF